MMNARWAALGVVVAAFVGLAALMAGCKGFWDAPASTGSGGTTPTTLSSGVFYVLNQKTQQIAAYSISSGKLVNVTNSPYTLPAAPSSIAVAPGGQFLYVGTLSGIYLYTIGSGGVLTIGNNGASISSDIPSAMTVSGSWLVDAFVQPATSPTVVEVDAIPIDSSTGAYTGCSGCAAPSQTFQIANSAVTQMVLSQDDLNLFVALGAGGTMVDPFTSGNANPLGATAKTIPVANSGGSALSVAVDPGSTPRLFYIGETLANSGGTSGGLRVFNYSSLGSASLTQATGSPIASGGLAPNAILPVTGGEYVYVANGTGTTSQGKIAWFPITASGTTYTIAAGSTVASGIQPVGLAEDSDSNFVLAVSTGGSTSSGNPDLDAYTISSGALTSAIQSAAGADPVQAIAVAALP